MKDRIPSNYIFQIILELYKAYINFYYPRKYTKPSLTSTAESGDEGTPVDGEIKPIDDEGTPVDDEGTPVDGEGTPVDGEIKPIDDEGTPVDGEVKPIDDEGISIDDEMKNLSPISSAISSDTSYCSSDLSSLSSDASNINTVTSLQMVSLWVFGLYCIYITYKFFQLCFSEKCK